jgi:hypothetical protein
VGSATASAALGATIAGPKTGVTACGCGARNRSNKRTAPQITTNNMPIRNAILATINTIPTIITVVIQDLLQSLPDIHTIVLLNENHLVIASRLDKEKFTFLISFSFTINTLG